MSRARNALLVCAVAALAVSVANALAGNDTGGNGAKACHKNGWQSLYTRTGQPFSSNSECTAYASAGGQLLTEAALVCLNGGWSTLGPDANTLFASEQVCVDFAVAGGTPVAAGADISLSVVGAGEISSLNTVCNPGWWINVSNAGPVDALIEVDLDVYGPLATMNYTYDPGWTVPELVYEDATRLTFRSSRTIVAGQTTRIDASSCDSPGTVSVHSSTVQDPDSTPGNGYVTGEDDAVQISGSGPS